MKYWILGFVSLLVTATVFSAPPTLTITPTNPKVGDTVTVTANAGTSPVTFDIRGTMFLAHPNKKAVVFILPDNGVVVLAAAGTSAKLTDVGVWMSGAGIGPGPGPQPPQPPQPDNELKAFTAKLTVYYKDEPEEEKATLKELLAVYTNASSLTKDATTLGKAFEALTAESTKRGIPGKLNLVRGAIAAELKKRLPWQAASDIALTGNTRTQFDAAMKFVADALTAVK